MIKCHQLSYSVSDKEILKDLNFELEAGKLYTIVGPNGAGKTTLLKLICRLLKSSGGEILLDDQPLFDYSQLELAQKIAYVPQKLSGPNGFSVSDFILQARFAWSQTSTKESDQSRLKRVLEQCEISHLAQQSMDTLSGGETQRCLLAAALCQESPLILLDEVTAGLDPGHHDSICQLIADINRLESKTILWVTHDLNTALHFSHQILVMQEGQLQKIGHPDELKDGTYFSQIYNKNFKCLRDEQGQQFLV